LFGILNITAHEEHKHKESVKDSSKHIVESKITNNGSIVKPNEKSEDEQPFILNYFEEAFEHFHNKLVHFPFALSFLAFLFTMFSFKWKQFDFSIKYIVLIAALMSLPTVITGLFQSNNFIGEPKEWVVGIHKILGISSMLVLWIWTIFLSVKPLQKFAWAISVISVILTTITGFYGGVISH